LSAVVLHPPSPPEPQQNVALSWPAAAAAPVQTVLDFWAEAPAAPPRPALRMVVLGSGSGGNAIVLEVGETRLLIDAGFSARELGRRMKGVGIDPASISALLLTHEHSDHCRGAARFARHHKLPVFATAGTLDGIELPEAVVANATTLRSGEVCELAGLRCEPFMLPHDAREPIGFVLEDSSGRRVGLVADCGTRSQLAWTRLRDLDVLILETNHDLEMLRSGPYPWPLKQRVAGRHGHLSNREAAEGLPELVNGRLQWVVLYHLSRTNNLPALAAAAVGEALDRSRCGARLVLSAQDFATPWLEVG
jgi:phosphoribosyl 1,2-cyclic phosphodiesterase